MYFDFESYRAYCYEGPVTTGLMFSIFVVACISSIVIQAVKKKLILRNAIIYTFFMLAYLLIVRMCIGQLLYGGVYLRYEKETDAVEIQGEITDIKGLEDFVFPTVKDGYGYEEKNGYEFTIDGVKCAANRKGSLKVGDYVTVKYLPKSGYILYIVETKE